MFKNISKTNHRLVLVFLLVFGLFSSSANAIFCQVGQKVCNGICIPDTMPCGDSTLKCPAGTYGSFSLATGCQECPDGYTSEIGSVFITQCYKSCTKPCTRQTCPSNATCTHGSSSTTGTQYYNSSCDAAASTCSISISCNSGYYKSGSGTSCSSCPSGKYCSGGVQHDCPTDYPSSSFGSSTITQCYKMYTVQCQEEQIGCPPNATCTYFHPSQNRVECYGGAETCGLINSELCIIKSSVCNSGYYGSGSSCPACTSVSATDLSQSCSRNPTSTELSNAHAYAGTISGATQKCTGNHTSGPTGATSSSQCTGCSSWGSCSGGTLTITSCAAGYYKDGNSCKSCPSGYTSDAGATSQSECYATCSTQSITGGNRVPVSGTVNYPNSCEYTTVCNDGYNQSSDGVCSQLCGLGFTTLRTGTGLVIPLYNEKLSSPAIHIGLSGGMCYGILKSGAGDGINLEYGGQTYHTIK